jgi:hypothetical protein
MGQVKVVRVSILFALLYSMLFGCSSGSSQSDLTALNAVQKMCSNIGAFTIRLNEDEVAAQTWVVSPAQEPSIEFYLLYFRSEKKWVIPTPDQSNVVAYSCINELSAE